MRARLERASSSLSSARRLLVLGDASSLFEQPPPVLDRVDLSLLDHRVGPDTEPGTHQQVAHVLQALDLAVDQVLALAGAVETPPDGELAVLGLLDARVGEQGEGDLGHAERLPASR